MPDVLDEKTAQMLHTAEELLAAAARPLVALTLLKEVVQRSGGDPDAIQSLVELQTAIALDNRFVPARVLGKATSHPLPVGRWVRSRCTKPFNLGIEPSKYRQAGQEFHSAWALKAWNLKSEFTEVENEADEEVEEPKKMRRVSRKKKGDVA